jgi:hypothetical protein
VARDGKTSPAHAFFLVGADESLFSHSGRVHLLHGQGLLQVVVEAYATPTIKYTVIDFRENRPLMST